MKTEKRNNQKYSNELSILIETITTLEHESSNIKKIHSRDTNLFYHNSK